MAWLFLIGAILSEVAATLSLRITVDGRKVWYVAVVGGYLLAFVFLSLALTQGMGLGVAYGIWAAGGVTLTALASRLFFKEPLSKVMSFGILLIIGGVLLVELGATH